MIIVTGASGQLGGDVCRELERLGLEFIGVTRSELDITNAAAVERFFDLHEADSLIHCAAYTAVDRAQSEPRLCLEANAEATAFLAQGCKKHGMKMLYISSDYVFSGEGSVPYETDSPAEPISVYGQSKLLGEIAVRGALEKYFIVRISWLFGEKNTNFVHTILRLGAERQRLEVVDDQIGSPTYSPHLAALLCTMIQSEKYGVYHATNEGFCSRAELAAKALSLAGIGAVVTGVKSERFQTAAKRPKNSRLSKKSLDEAGFDRLAHWETALGQYISKIALP